MRCSWRDTERISTGGMKNEVEELRKREERMTGVKEDKKKTLSAREYLRQLELIDVQIAQDVERLEEMKEIAMNTGSIDYARDRVQTSQEGDKLCAAVTKFTDFEEKISREIESFAVMKEQIIGEIRGLYDVNYIQVLYKVYVQFKTIKIAAQEMKKSYNYVAHVHLQALKAFEERYKSLHRIV